MKTNNSFKRVMAALALLVMFSTASAQWETYDASSVPDAAGWNVKNGAGAAATINLEDDAENPGNKILRFISGVADKNTLEAPKFDSKVSGGGSKQAFTVVLRAKGLGITDGSGSHNLMEVEVKDGEIRDKVRFYQDQLDIEKANAKAKKTYPEGHNSSDFNIYRVTFENGITKVWVNDVLVDESAVASTTSSDSDSRFVIGDSNSSADYSVAYDWIIWDKSGAYAPGEGSAYPADLILSPLGGGETGGDNWSVYDASQTPEEAGFSPGSSSGFGGDVNVVTDSENAGNKLVELIGPAELKNYWKHYLQDSAAIADDGVSIVTRMKAENSSSYVAAIQVTTGAYYAKIYVRNNGEVKVDGDQTYATGLDFSSFHVFRVTMKGSRLNIWVDDVKYCDNYEVTATSSNSPSFRIGDASSSDAYSAVIDWIIWDETGAYAPGEGSDYPSSLIIDPLEGGGGVVVPDFVHFADNEIAAAQAGESFTDIVLEANTDWNIGSTDAWITDITPLQGGSGTHTFSFAVAENAGPAPRTGKIYALYGEDEMSFLSITQPGLAEEISPASATASSEQEKDGVFMVAGNAIDGDAATNWVPSAGVLNGESEWIKVALDESSEVVMMKITEAKNNARKLVFSVDYWDGAAYAEALPKTMMEMQPAAATEVAFALDNAVQTDTIRVNVYGCVTGDDPAEAAGWFTIPEISIWGGKSGSTNINDAQAATYTVYPNPSAGDITIVNAQGADVKIISLSGQTLFSLSNISAQEFVSLDLPSGIYLLKVDDQVSRIVIK